MKLIHDLSKSELAIVCKENKLPGYRSKQIWQWLYDKKVTSWNEMLNIPEKARELLASQFSLDSAIVDEINGDTGQTQKILAKLHDGEKVEEVLIVGKERRTVCLSCQAGCKFNCTFCASGKAGLSRNLSSGEMIGQLLLASRASDKRISNIVFMGTGEPFDNYDEVIKAINIINDDSAFSIGARKITISTCGIIPGIKRLADEKLQIGLSVSLHAPNDKLRSHLMPINNKYPLSKLVPACRAFSKQTNRIMTFEYTLIDGTNNSMEHAQQLVKLLKNVPCKVNLIPLSSTTEFKAKAPNQTSADKFLEKLEKSGIHATMRNSQGSAIKAACGQLRYGRADS